MVSATAAFEVAGYKKRTSLATAGAYATWNYAVARLGVMKSSVYIYLIPVITIICSAIILKEKVTIGGVMGCLLTMAGLFLSEKKVKRADKA